MKRPVIAALAVAFVGLVGWAQAQEKASPVGTWKWEQTFGGNSREVVLKLKLDGEKLTGTVSGRQGGMDTEISDGKFKDGEVSFTVVREFNGNKRTSKYNGKLDKDVIKGKLERETMDGTTEKVDWEAKREKA